MIRDKILLFFICCAFSPLAEAQTAIERFLQAPYMQGASFSLLVKEVESGKTVYSYDPERLLTPASVLKAMKDQKLQMDQEPVRTVPAKDRESR